MRSPRSSAMAGLAIGLLAITTSGAAAQGGATLTVAQDGSSDYPTIAAAVEAASDGDTILISPGTYAEGLVIDKDITLTGDGTRGEVLVSPGPADVVIVEGPSDAAPVAIHFLDSDATVEHIAFTLAPGEGVVAWLEGGAAAFSDVSFSGGSVVIVGGEPRFTDSVVDAYFAVRDGASPTVVDSEFLGHASIDGPGRTVIRNSVLRGGTSASADATGAYEDNHFIGAQLAVDTGSEMLVKGNLVEGVQEYPAIGVYGPGASAQIVNNTVRDSRTGISVDSDEPGSTVVGNTISGVRVGIHVDSEAEVPVEDNVISEASSFGIVLTAGIPFVSGNSICGTGRAFEFRGEVEPRLGTNEVCAELEP